MLPLYDPKTSNLFRYCRKHIPNFHIDEEMQKALCFRERLEVFCKDNSSMKLEKVGEYFLSVESIGPRSQELFVQIILSLTVNSCLFVSKITSSATKELHCLEEKKYEFSEINNSLREKNVYVGNGDNGYFVKVTEKSIKNKESKTICIPYEGSKIISDGSSILLMRYLAMTNYCGTLTFDIITLEGNIDKCDYECSSIDMKINNADIKVLQIIQKFRFFCAVTGTIQNILSMQGNFISINFMNSPYIIKINPNADCSIIQKGPIILPLSETWKEDFELISKHFDKKIFKEDEKRKYLLLHSEIIELLSDYIQSLLCKKPDDVLKFTVDYFQILTSDEN